MVELRVLGNVSHGRDGSQRQGGTYWPFRKTRGK